MAVPAERLIPSWSFGDRVRKARRLRGMTAEELSEALGLSPKAVSYWEVNDSHPRNVVEVSRRIAEVTGVDFYWILTGEPAITVDFAPRCTQ